MRNRRVICLLGLLSAAMFAAGTVHAAGYIKLGDIKGEVQASERHREWIEVVSFSSAVGNYDASGRFTARTQTGTASRGTLTISKKYDKASPILMQACAKGEHKQSAEIELCGADGQCARYVLSDVVIERYTLTRTTEELTLNYAKIDWSPVAAAPATIAAPPSSTRPR